MVDAGPSDPATATMSLAERAAADGTRFVLATFVDLEKTVKKVKDRNNKCLEKLKEWQYIKIM